MDCGLCDRGSGTVIVEGRVRLQILLLVFESVVGLLVLPLDSSGLGVVVCRGQYPS